MINIMNKNLIIKTIKSLRNEGIRVTLSKITKRLKSESNSSEMSESQKINNIIKQENLTELTKYINLKEYNYDLEGKSVTIIIPVYNGLVHLRRLFPSLIQNTSNQVKIIIINDNSTDQNVLDCIDEFRIKHGNVDIINNEKNLGFVSSINKGMRAVRTEYAVWLNTDTVVPSMWLERLLYPFGKYDKIATTTPFTNSGVTFSFPKFGENNDVKYPLDECDHAFQKICNFNSLINCTYSGTGFCMAIDMRCWQEVGELDYEAFGKGYGEENDWCFRAGINGWKHLIVPNLFIQHCHGGSFNSEEKIKLCEKHVEVLKKRYPKEMNDIVPEFFSKDPWSIYRKIAALMLSNSNTILVIDLKENNGMHSGAVDYRNSLLKDLEKDGFRVVLLQYTMGKDTRWSLIPFSVDSELEIGLEDFSEVKILFDFLDIKKVVINNFAFLEEIEKTIDILHNILKINNTMIEYKFHDYLSCCPSFFLIDNQDCVCERYFDKIHCNNCLENNCNRAIIRVDIEKWRNMWLKLFLIVDEFEFFSEYTYHIVSKIYPIVQTRYRIKEHVSLMSENHSVYVMPEYNDLLTVAFVGNFCEAKGSKYFIGLRELLNQKGIKNRFIIIGLDNYPHSNTIDYIGQYNRDDLGDILTREKVNAVIYPSTCNETFSYVAQELMSLSVPFVVFSKGAPAERIRKQNYFYAEIASSITINELYKSLSSLVKKVYHNDI